MPGAFDLIGVLARFVFVAGACLLTGVFAFQVFVVWPALRAAGPAARERFRTLDRRLLALAAGALAAAMGTGFVDLVRQAVVATGGGVAGSLVPQTIGALLGETRYGDIWLVRQMLWLLLALLLLLRGPERGSADWLAVRLAGLVLAAASLAASAASGHAASAPERATLSIAVDALHLLAAGVWTGALLPLVLLLREAASGRADAPPPAVAVAIRRFSMLGLLGVTVMLASGGYAMLQQVGSFPALLGTTYGHWLVLKLALFVTLLVVALLNRAYLRPRLERALVEVDEREPRARVLVARLGRFVLFETLLAAGILGAVAVLGLTTPARHDPVAWPLPFRFAWELTIGLPGVWRRVMAGGVVAAVGVAAALALVAVRRPSWRPALVGGAAAVALGLALAAPPIAVDAYPTTYVRPAVPYTAASIVRGQALYGEHCSRCHGASGVGDGPPAAGVTRTPADLTARRTTDRTAGDLFWWVSHDAPVSDTRAQLTREQRWDVVNFLRTLAAAETARGLGSTVSAKPMVVAPDVRYTTGVSGERALRDHRGQTIVLLVFFRLPESLERLRRLSRAYFDLRVLGVEVVAVPLEGARTLYRTLGPQPLLFPFVIDGAEDAVTAYRHFHPGTPWPAHVEMAIDRRGYLRAHWVPSATLRAPGGWNDVNTLLQELTRLAGEPRSAPILGEHIH